MFVFDFIKLRKEESCKGPSSCDPTCGSNSWRRSPQKFIWRTSATTPAATSDRSNQPSRWVSHSRRSTTHFRSHLTKTSSMTNTNHQPVARRSPTTLKTPTGRTTPSDSVTRFLRNKDGNLAIPLVLRTLPTRRTTRKPRNRTFVSF